jgi:rare lipoprotein A
MFSLYFYFSSGFGRRGIVKMSSIGRVGRLPVRGGSGGSVSDRRTLATARSAVSLLTLVATLALAGCAQGPTAANKNELRTSRLQRAPSDPAGPHYGLASFYDEGQETASGEKFDPHQLTAAHPTLPFGTRLRVTNVTTGRSVTVLVNDRGPFVDGRVVDVSYAAAEQLGIVGQGVARVKLDVIQ